MELLRATEPRTLEGIWRRYGAGLTLYAAALLKDRSQAEDVLQTLFVRFLSSGTLPPAEGEATHLFTAVRNVALNDLRSLKRAQRAYSALLEPVAEDPWAIAQRGELWLRLETVLLELPPEEREAIVLKAWGDVSFAQGAEISGVSAKTFESRYYKGLGILQEKLGPLHE
jgi:RNA polymerase sigma-70 factor (ECF subfamily)